MVLLRLPSSPFPDLRPPRVLDPGQVADSLSPSELIIWAAAFAEHGEGHPALRLPAATGPMQLQAFLLERVTYAAGASAAVRAHAPNGRPLSVFTELGR